MILRTRRQQRAIRSHSSNESCSSRLWQRRRVAHKQACVSRRVLTRLHDCSDCEQSSACFVQGEGDASSTEAIALIGDLKTWASPAWRAGHEMAPSLHVIGVTLLRLAGIFHSLGSQEVRKRVIDSIPPAPRPRPRMISQSWSQGPVVTVNVHCPLSISGQCSLDRTGPDWTGSC